MKKDIEDLLIIIKPIKENTLIYENDIDNSCKEYYIKFLENINKILENNEIKLIDLTPPKTQNSKNEIICIYNIKKGKYNKNDYLTKPIRILNYYKEAKKKNNKLENINKKEAKHK